MYMRNPCGQHHTCLVDIYRLQIVKAVLPTMIAMSRCFSISPGSGSVSVRAGCVVAGGRQHELCIITNRIVKALDIMPGESTRMMLVGRRYGWGKRCVFHMLVNVVMIVVSRQISVGHKALSLEPPTYAPTKYPSSWQPAEFTYNYPRRPEEPHLLPPVVQHPLPPTSHRTLLLLVGPPVRQQQRDRLLRLSKQTTLPKNPPPSFRQRTNSKLPQRGSRDPKSGRLRNAPRWRNARC